VLGCDYFSAYRKYMGDLGVQVQFCLAHLIRDVKFLTTLDEATRKYGERLLDRLRAVFRLIHRREKMRPEGFRRALERERKGIVRAARHPPWTREARNMAERFRRHGHAYFRFITTPGVEPTNNLAEQALRFVVIQRRMTHTTLRHCSAEATQCGAESSASLRSTRGTRGPAGRAWCERIWTAVATCRQQGGRSSSTFTAPFTPTSPASPRPHSCPLDRKAVNSYG